MIVSHGGLHQRTFQKHLKVEFRPASVAASESVFSDAVEGKVYAEINLRFTKNVTVVYDSTWMTHGHTSHIGVGTVIEFYTGLVINSVFCLTDAIIAPWAQKRVKRNTASGRNPMNQNVKRTPM